METAVVDISTKKNLGQYFSGSLISKMLAELACHSKASSILDPMNGSGDMLWACEASMRSRKEYYGVEVDRNVFEQSKGRFAEFNVTLLQGNAFSQRVIDYLSEVQYDLIITNPPYVRYQTIAKNKDCIPESLSTSEIKSNLIASLSLLEHLDGVDRTLFETLISKYSGLADLAVPSWLMCALNVKIGGRIALVVPEAWMNRNYAGVIQYVLLRWFQLEYIVEDGHSVWFKDAQVKTTLMVAKRIKRKSSICSWKGEFFVTSSIYSASMNSKSLVGQAFPNATKPEAKFKDLIDKGDSVEGMFSTSRVRIASFANDIVRGIEHSGWYELVEPNRPKLDAAGNALRSRSKLKYWINGSDTKFLSLNDLGVQVSQGLRTGANAFFYLDIVKKTKTGVITQPKQELYPSELFVPNRFFKYVVSRQSELNESYSTDNFVPKKIVLCLQNGIGQSDLELLRQKHSSLLSSYKELSSEISRYIEQAEQINIGTIDEPKYIPELTAVAPNARSWDRAKPNLPPRFWYMLPEFSKRHLPDLFIPRVNGAHPKTRLNPHGAYAVDANFSTLWTKKNSSALNNWTILALLNSSWCVIAMEEHGTVMGGGALKLEATQIRSIPIPEMSDLQLKELSRFGRLLSSNEVDSSQIIEKIDRVIIESFCFKTNIKKRLKELELLKGELLAQRAKRNS